MEKIIGIVSEYNPFHEGHAYHIQESKKAVGDDAAVVCVMSGDFVQRGEWAIQPKSLRAEAACRGGADLVTELPLPWCLASAGYFASGAVSVLKALGITHLSFGSECGNLELLQNASSSLTDGRIRNEIRSYMKQDRTVNYPSARSAVLGGTLPASPNDLLAVEYLQAIQGTVIEPLAVRRAGLLHDERGDAVFLSASEIRSRILSGKIEVQHIDHDKMNLACVSRLRMLQREEFDLLPDCQDGLGQRIFEAVREEASLDAICATAKTKRYTLSRVRRSVLCAALNLRKEYLCSEPPYVRILAFNQRGRKLLASLKKDASVPILTQPKEVLKLDGTAQNIFQLGSAAHDLFMLCYPGRENDRCGEDYRNGPVFVES